MTTRSSGQARWHTNPRAPVLTIIGSSGGAALQGAVACLHASNQRLAFCILTDRECGLAAWGRRAGYPTEVLPYDSALAFSRLAANRMRDAGSTDALLFYTRRVAGPLVEEVQTVNVHPSLLPAFAGLHAVREARRAAAQHLGATLHRVDHSVDTGPMLGQVWCPMPDPGAAALANRLSFLQKVWLTLAWCEHAQSGQWPTPAPAAVVHDAGEAITAGTIGPSDRALRAAYLLFVRDALHGTPANMPPAGHLTI